MIGIISVTKKGDSIADKIYNILGGVVYKKSSDKEFSLKYITKKSFENHKCIIFVSSTGIAVRAIAEFLKGKDLDPAVIVVDVCNNFTISLVSGHLGGANYLTNKVSSILGNIPVITTATDNLQIEAPDMVALNNKLVIGDLKIAKVIASRLVNGEEVYFKDDKNLVACPNGYILKTEVNGNILWITSKLYDNDYVKNNQSSQYSNSRSDNLESILMNNEIKSTLMIGQDDLANRLLKLYRKNNILKLIRKDIVLGIGCRRNTDSKKLYDFVSEMLIQNNIDIRAVKTIASIDIKADEEAILDLAMKIQCDLKFFSKLEISLVDSKYDGSDFVKKTVGVRAVSEPAVELLGAEIIKGKIRYEGMTLTIGILPN